MPLRQFNADVTAAASKASSGGFEGITSIKKGDSDGELVVRYDHERLTSPLQVRLLSQDVDEYPGTSGFFLFTDSEDAPPQLFSIMTDLQDVSAGRKVNEMLSALAHKFSRELKSSSTSDGVVDHDGDVEMTDVEDDMHDDEDEADFGQESSEDEEEDDDFDDALFGIPSDRPQAPRGPTLSAEASRARQQRIKWDLRQAKAAGFKVGILSGMEPSASTNVVSISVRASKLGLSEQALQTWDIKVTDYVVLLFRVNGPYRTFEETMELPAGSSHLQFRIGKCTRYKPELTSALASFSESGPTQSGYDLRDRPGADGKNPDFAKTIVSNSLNQYMNESFMSLVKLRETRALSWEDANTCILDHMGRIDADFKPAAGAQSPQKHLANNEDGPDSIRPNILNCDHLSEGAGGRRSLPLIAVQFAVRYFARCTKYCLRCHRKVEEGFEALKPYVCSNPLCLFQYMAMGFGPSVEHEILFQPKVVDLLVSFCYSALTPTASGYAVGTAYGDSIKPTFAIREFPVGLQLKVPHTSVVGITGFIDSSHRKFIVDGALDLDRISVGQWVAFRVATQPGTAPLLPPTSPATLYSGVRTPLYHARVLHINFATRELDLLYMGPSGSVNANTVIVHQAGSAQPAMPSKTPPLDPTSPSGVPDRRASLIHYSADFDSLDEAEKGVAMKDILDTLPRISDIKEFLETNPHRNLRMMDSVSPAAAALLEWIVASNRSCILQSEEPDPETGVGPSQIIGVDHWTQFRFAQGSPDKELRFNRALQEVVSRKQPKHPTIFAWHGSALSNWHSIVRTGLDYKQTLHGRAFGDGVYFSPDFTTSSGYSGNYAFNCWPNSELKAAAAISLNEVVNAPDEFRSQRPHYVVAQQDWHQCRFLFVQTSSGPADRAAPPSSKPKSIVPSKPKDLSLYYIQDPIWSVKGPTGMVLGIPLSAMASARRADGSQAEDVALNFGDGATDSGDEEDALDIAFFSLDDDESRDKGKRNEEYSRSSSVDTVTARKITTARPLTPASTNNQMTEFRPGALDLATLPRLPPPAWASSLGLRNLSVEVSKLQAMQERTAMHELGWFVDFEKLENLFQWIVELHSFDLSLPLAQDMKKAGIASIVCEIRFGPQFPYSPPFVRIVRPRFLPFASGGGGHVTAGGAMCMELLTNSGWSPANSLEAVLLQVRMALCSTDPRPARLDQSQLRGFRADYNIGEALEAFTRAALMHGWKVPDDLQQTVVEFEKTTAPSSG